jgi:gluconolactonase
LEVLPVWRLAALAVVAAAPLLAAEPVRYYYPTLGSIERLDSALDRLLDRDAVIEKLAGGFEWTEGPVWVPAEQCLLFSDIPRNTVYRWKENEGVTRFLRPSGYTGEKKRGGELGSNGLLLDPEGRLVLCEHGDRRIARLEKDGKKTTLADRYDGKRLHSPNDGVFKSNGDLYFTDPPYGLERNWFDSARELSFCGVYRLSRSGTLTLLTKELARPNGIAFSPDEKTLYVSNSDPLQPLWKAYPVKEDGTLAEGKVFFDAAELLRARKLGMPDGLKVDRTGHLFATGPGGVLILSPEGKHLGTINTGAPTGNCAWGDDGSVLYITANQDLCRIRTKTKGKGW